MLDATDPAAGQDVLVNFRTKTWKAVTAGRPEGSGDMNERTCSHQALSQENLSLAVEVFARTADKTRAARAVGVTTTTLHKWLNRSRLKQDERYLITDPLGDEPDVWFHEAMEQAEPSAVANVESSFLDTFMTGTPEPVIYKGRLMHVEDTEADPEVRVVDGEAFIAYPPKKDENGRAIPLVVHKKNLAGYQFWLTKRGGKDWGDKSQVDVTSGGKPIFFSTPSKDSKSWEDETK